MKYYCPLKFTDLQIHIQSRLLYNCCHAYPERIDIDWLEKNPGKLFHTPTMIQDRIDMLKDKSTQACYHGCYKYEEKGSPSVRSQIKNKNYINDPYNPLTSLMISLSTDCNLTCAYCSPEWSTSWYEDVEKNGKYDIEGYEEKKNNFAKLWSKMKQKKRSVDNKFFKLILKEISLAKHIKDIAILGGEPLLNNNLLDVINELKHEKISIITGLGLSLERLKTILDKVKNKNIEFHISAESTEEHYNFIRYGSSWNDFLKKIDMIKTFGNKVKFLATINNLCIFKIKDFYELFSEKNEILFNQVTERPFLEANVLDDRSKEKFITSIGKNTSINFYKKIIELIEVPYKEEQRRNLSKFLKEFSKRRNLSLDIFPEHFLKWLEII